MSARLLVVDDEAGIRESLGKVLRYEGFAVDTAPDGATALALAARQPFDLIFLDVKMPGMDGLEVLARLGEGGLATPVVIISGHGTIDTAVQATKLGAFDFLEKPLDADRVLVTLRNALAWLDQQRQIEQLRQRLGEGEQIVGESQAVKALLKAIERVAPTDARVLITGENGSGKELVARRIHRLSARAEGPFVDVNCAAIPNELIESELFGHEKGSFTGAHQQRMGRFEQADGGTLFLDEIGDMSLSAQAKVLRVLQEGKFERVGGTVTQQVNVRVIAATNKDLLAEAAENRFREDLYYRLNVVPLEVPPLRERPDDIPLLAKHFMELYLREQGMRPRLFTPAALEQLRGYRWPGNIRELRNLVERLLIMAPGDRIEVEDIPLPGGEAASGEAGLFAAPSFQAFKERSEAVFLARKLREHGGNVSRTARALEMQRSNLYKKIERYGLTAGKPDPDEPGEEAD